MRRGVPTEIMAHTGDGKSAFMRQLAEGAAKDEAGVLWFVGEDPEDATAERQFSAGTGIDSSDLGRLDLNKGQLDQVDLAAKQAAPWAKRILPVFDMLEMDELLTIVDETTSVGGSPLGAVLVDYVQIFGNPDNMESEIARFGKEINKRAKERRFAIGLGSQVSNDVVKRGRDRYHATHEISAMRPSIGDTEWCKRLEKVVKTVWSLYRPNRWKREFGDESLEDNNGELHVIKANFGPMGFIELDWDGPTTTYKSRR